MANKPLPTLAGRTVRCILFDLGSTVWYGNKRDGSQAEAASDKRTGALLRQHVAPELLPDGDDEELGSYLRRAFDEYLRETILRDQTVEPNGAYAFLQILPQWGIKDVDLALSTAIYEALRIPETQSRRLFEDSIATLDALQERGFQLGVVTNRYWGGQTFIDVMDSFALLKYFDPAKMAISVDLGLRKPFPPIYLHALRAHGIASEETAFVGNSLSADVVGPQELDMIGIWRPKQTVTDAAKAHLARHGATLEMYNAGQFSLPRLDETEPDPPGPTPVFKSLLADIVDHAGYWRRFARGQVKPDLIIERMSDLLDVFVEPGEQ